MVMEAEREGLSGVVIAAYIDDIFFAAIDHDTMRALKRISDRLATKLGIAFKADKDEGFEQPTYALVWLGFHIRT